MTPEDETELARRRKQRNYVLGAILVGLSLLFYFITIARMS